jgi:hypothetical protein
MDAYRTEPLERGRGFLDAGVAGARAQVEAKLAWLRAIGERLADSSDDPPPD